jgi:hypothetical protein
MLELAADLSFFREPADHFGMIAVFLENHLDGQVAAKVDVSALEDDPHPSARDFTKKVVPTNVTEQLGHLVRMCPERPLFVHVAVPEQHARHWPDAFIQRPQHARG